MSTANSSFLERFIRLLTRGPDKPRQHSEEIRQEPHRWLNLR